MPRWITLGGGLLLSLGWFVHGWQVAAPGMIDRSGRLKGADYIQFYVMGGQVREGRADTLYDTRAIAASARRIAPGLDYHPERNPYGPQVALIFSPLSELPFLDSLAIFSVLSVIGYAVSVWLLWRTAPGLAADHAVVALLAAGCPAMLTTLRFGQISTFTLLAPVLAVATLPLDRMMAGAALGLLAYKPQLLFIAVPVLAMARDWRCLAGLGITASGQLAWAWGTLGGEVLREYLRTLRDVAAHPDLVMLYPENSHSVRGFLRLLGVSGQTASWITLLLTLAALPLVAKFWRSGATPLARVGLVVLVTLLLAPHVLTYDLLLLVVPLVALADWASRHPTDIRTETALVLSVALYLAPFSSALAPESHLQLSTLAIGAAAWILWHVQSPELHTTPR